MLNSYLKPFLIETAHFFLSQPNRLVAAIWLKEANIVFSKLIFVFLHAIYVYKKVNMIKKQFIAKYNRLIMPLKQ